MFKRVKKYSLTDRIKERPVPGTAAERVAMVWPLTREAASLSKHHDVERRLQRDVTRLIRRRD